MAIRTHQQIAKAIEDELGDVWMHSHDLLHALGRRGIDMHDASRVLSDLIDSGDVMEDAKMNVRCIMPRTEG